MLDRDGNGFISKQELGMAMRSLGYMPSEVELAIIMQRLDMDGEFLYLSLIYFKLALFLIGLYFPPSHTMPLISIKTSLLRLIRNTCLIYFKQKSPSHLSYFTLFWSLH